MKCLVIYYSQTGNTEKVARAIQAGVIAEAGHCDLVRIKDANPGALNTYDLIGVGCPVYDLYEPLNVKLFINKMRFVGGRHVFAFSTHGCLPEFFAPSIMPRLKRRGLVVIGIRDWYAKSYLPMTPDPYPTDGHPDATDLQEAEAFGSAMVKRSQRIAAGESDLIPPIPPSPPPMPALPPLPNVDLNQMSNPFRAMLRFHKEKCLFPECTLCMENCPMDGMDHSVNPSVIATPCIGCNFCTMICPTGALDDSAWLGLFAAGHHNLESMKADLLPRLAQAEADGAFRRLVPVEKIGFDTPLCVTHSGRPMWTIGKGLS
jgi:flavodoxin/NAD-dependent dihydropyrimidine dehydrogenase PreA subunit